MRPSRSLDNPRSPSLRGELRGELRHHAIIVAWAFGYVLAVKLAERGYGSISVPSPFWLPDSVLLCALLLMPKRQWWIALAAMWPLRFLAGVVPSTPLWFQLLAIANDGLKALVAAWMLRRFLGPTIRLHALREWLIFLLVAAVAVPVLSAVAAAPARYMLGGQVWAAAYQWFLGDSVSQVVVTPMLLYWCNREYRRLQGRLGELLMLLASLLVVSLFSFVFVLPAHPSILIYAPIPLILWAAIRLRPFGTANAIALVAGVSIVSVARGTNIFAVATTSDVVLWLQLFLLLFGVSLMSLAIVVAEREVLLRREMTFNQQLLRVQERERERLARELHDDISQRLALAKIDLDLLSNAEGVPTVAYQKLDRLGQLVDQITSDLRAVSHNLHPSVLKILGVEAALRRLCEEISARYEVVVDFTSSSVPRSLPGDVAVTLFRIAQEGLQNFVKHSGAHRATVRLSFDDDPAVLLISDLGRGFDRDDVAQREGLGLTSMRERAQSFGGTLHITSSPRTGTTVKVKIPLQAVDARASRNQVA